MTKQEAVNEFIEAAGIEWIKDKAKTDKPMLQLNWGDFTDSLCRDGRITDRQRMTWTTPTHWRIS